jgi:D-amino-acid dehydrogenase
MLQAAAFAPVKGAEILVIGGGMVGSACALALQHAGARATLVDPGDARARASFGNAGQICIDHCEPGANLANVWSAAGRLFAFGGPLDFRARDWDLWAPWTAEYLRACLPGRFRSGTAATAALQARSIPAWRTLLDLAGRPDLLEPVGYFGLWENEAAARFGTAALQRSDLGPATVRPVTPQELARLREVFAGRPAGGVLFDNSAKLRDPGGTVEALQAAFAAAGGVLLQGRVARLETAGRTSAVLDSGERLSPQRIVVCGGVRSRSLMRDLGVRAPLIAERGYHLHFAEHRWPADVAPALFQDRWVLATRFDTGVRLTSFTELARPDTPPDPRKWAALRRHAEALGVPVEGEGEEWMGARPTLPDFLPAIGRVAGRPEVLYAFGHQHVGVTLAAATAEAVLELAGAETTPPRLGAFDLQRFR